MLDDTDNRLRLRGLNSFEFLVSLRRVEVEEEDAPFSVEP